MRILAIDHGSHRIGIAISDELFSIDRGRILEFCDRIAAYRVPWSVALKVADVDRPLLDTMERAGCKEISYGIESGDDRILASRKKKIVLAYSGGLDTTVIVPWLKENYDCDVIAACGDVGQEADWAAMEKRAFRTRPSPCDPARSSPSDRSQTQVKAFSTRSAL